MNIVVKIGLDSVHWFLRRLSKRQVDEMTQHKNRFPKNLVFPLNLQVPSILVKAIYLMVTSLV